MRPPIIVTRAQPGADETAGRLQSEGFTPLLSPALVIKAVSPIPAQQEPARHLIFTSANGVRYFANTSQERDAQAWCVGDATAAEAHASGFTHIHNAKGNADDLAALILKRTPLKTDTWSHVANTAAAGKLVAILKAAGLNISFQPLYETAPAPHLSVPAHTALSTTSAKIVLIHSAKGAAAFLHLARDLNLSSATIAAISPNAAAPFLGVPTGVIIRAARPNEDALMQAVHIAAQTL